MRKFTFLLGLIAMVAVMFTACQKTEVTADELKTSVVFTPIVEQNSTSLVKNSVDPSVLGNQEIKAAVTAISINANHLSSSYSISDTWAVEDGGADELRLYDVAIGPNMFTAETTSALYYPELVDQTETLDGVYSGKVNNIEATIKARIFWWTIEWTEQYGYTTASLAQALRHTIPFVEFEGSSHADVTYSNSAPVDMYMNAEQGRLIVTFEFEDVKLAEAYRAEVEVTHQGDGTTAPVNVENYSFRFGSCWLGGIKEVDQYAWFYLNNETVNVNDNISLTINLYDKDDVNGDLVLRTWSITSASHNDEIAIANGIDKWLNVTLTESAFKTSYAGFNFDFEWSIEDTEIILGN